MAQMAFQHTPVLLEEVLDALDLKAGGAYVDGTLGGAGHAAEVLRRTGAGAVLYGCDQDGEALAAARAHLEALGVLPQARLYHTNYENIVSVLKGEGVEGVDGILLDLGVSSYQLDNAERGFSYREDAPLDMRMDRRQTRTAADIVNGESEQELARILSVYGEEKCARSIAGNIVRRREQQAIRTTYELNDIIREAMPARMRRDGHPSKRSFQALRIACNRELEVLEASLMQMMEFLKPAGRLAVVSFHSLEDRIVKEAMRTAERPCTCPPELPVCVCGRVPLGRCVTRHPKVAAEEELARNPRAKSAKLRVFEREP